MKVLNQALFEISVVVHNLMVNPGDVPNDYQWVLNEDGTKVSYHNGEWYIYSDYYDEEECVCSTPKLWYGIPKFDIEISELEKLSKEELIQIILKKEARNNE